MYRAHERIEGEKCPVETLDVQRKRGLVQDACMPFADSSSFNKFATKIDKYCLGFDYVKCPYYKKKMKEKRQR